MSNTLVTEYVLEAPGYDATGRKITQTTKEITEAQDKAAASAKKLNGALQDSALPGLDRIANDARRALSPPKPGPGGRPVATVGGVSWIHRDPASPVSPQAHPTVRPHIDWSGARKQTSDFFDGIRDGVQGAMSDLSPLKAVGTSLAAFAAVAAATGFGLMKEAASFDSLRQSLVSIEGGSKQAGKALGDLKKIAAAPGIGFEESVRAYTGLRNVGYDQAFSERIEKEVANATAKGGGGAEEFGRIMLQLRQAAGREFLSQDDLTPIGEAGIPVNSILKKLYSTGDTEELKGKGITADKAIHDLVDELAKLPRVAGGAQNSLDNAGDALKFLEVSAGEALNNALLPLFDELANAAQELTENGTIAAAFESIAENIKMMFETDQDGLEGAIKELTMAAVQLSIYSRNLVENGKGAADFAEKAGDAWQWFAHPATHKAPWDSDYDEWKKNQAGQDPWSTAGGEAEYTGKGIDAEVESKRIQKERESFRAAKAAGKFNGTWKEWQALSKEQREKATPEGKAATGAPKETKAEQTQERIARATERTADYMKKRMDMDAASAGGGELTRLGVSPVEMSGRSIGSRERAIRHAVELIAHAMGGFVDSREVGNARHSSRN